MQVSEEPKRCTKIKGDADDNCGHDCYLWVGIKKEACFLNKM
jgi:hypothetical protein